MDETILFPSPNWFQVSGLAVTSDGWLIYGGPSKSLCVLQPLPSSYDAVVRGRTGYKAHVINRVNPEKIVCLDVSPEWPEKRTFVTGSFDGTVKKWLVTEQDDGLDFKVSFVHDAHSKSKEEMVGIGYSNETVAISVGSFANIVKWDTNSNVTKVYTNFMKNFRPTCVSVSRHVDLNVAIGTKQGVVFLINLTGSGRIIYKIRAHDDEILQMNWCPQYKVEVRKSLNYTLASRLEKIRNQPEASNDDSGLSKVISADKFTSIDFTKPETLSATENENAKHDENKNAEKLNTSDLSNVAEDKKAENLNKPETSSTAECLNSSEGPNSTVVEEDDLFNMYKDHASEEFGHKKYEPETIFVKIQNEDKPNDFLAECLKLKQDILKNKNESEATIESLVDALDKTHVDKVVEAKVSEDAHNDDDDGEEVSSSDGVSSVHVQRHLLVSIARQGTIRIWSKSGKMVSSGTVFNGFVKGKMKPMSCMTVLWHKPDCLLIADGRNQLLQCNPLKIDSKTKLEYHTVHSMHRRGLFAIASGAPRIQTDTDGATQYWPVWTAAQDRSMVEYCLKEQKALSVHATCGSYVYWIDVCPYDARKVAVAVSDGAVRVWEADTLQESDSNLSQGHFAMYWQNVQGKVYCIAWHPTRENMIAFATAEARVGLIDTSGKSEKPAKVLRPTLHSAIYGLCWGEGYTLYACGGGELVAYQADRPDDAPKLIKVKVDGVQWKLCEVVWTPRALLLGSEDGAVAVLTASAPHTVVTQAFPFTKMIHKLDWHPQQVSDSSEESPNKDLIAACSVEKTSNVVILKLSENDVGEIKLFTHSTLSGHKGVVNKVCWNPHREALLLSSSQDGTVRVWDVTQGVCTSIFGGHKQTTLGIAWSGNPALWDLALSGGGDQSVRMWRIGDHLAENFIEHKSNLERREKKRSKDKDAIKDKETIKDKDTIKDKESIKEQENGESDKDESDTDKPTEQNEPTTDNRNRKMKRFLLTKIRKQIAAIKISACRIVFEKYKEKHGSAKEVNGDTNGDGDKNLNGDKNGEIDKNENGDKIEDNDKIGDKNGDGAKNHDGGKKGGATDFRTDFVKIFGSINDVNEMMDKELQRHEELGNHESWIMLSIFRGNIDSVFKYAAQRDIICPYLLSIAPCVSFKYWKDMTQLYVAQIDRLTAKNEEAKLAESKTFGGPVYRKVATLLSIHDVKGAVNALTERKLFTEAYVLCRVRHMDSVAEDTLRAWASFSYWSGAFIISAICSITLGDLTQAASVLGRSPHEDHISLAAEIAKLAGQTSFATHCQEKTDKLKCDNDNKKEVLEELKKLPSRMEALMMKGDSNSDDGGKSDVNGDEKCDVNIGGDAL